MQTIKLNGGTLTLPAEAMQQIGPNDEVAVITSGDTIILKKIKPLKLSEIAERATDEAPMPLDEISRDVHRYRRTRSARR